MKATLEFIIPDDESENKEKAVESEESKELNK